MSLFLFMIHSIQLMTIHLTRLFNVYTNNTDPPSPKLTSRSSPSRPTSASLARMPSMQTLPWRHWHHMLPWISISGESIHLRYIGQGGTPIPDIAETVNGGRIRSDHIASRDPWVAPLVLCWPKEDKCIMAFRLTYSSVITRLEIKLIERPTDCGMYWCWVW